MQFHIFTIIFTIIIYIYLRYNKEQYNGDYSIYSLIIPILLYSYNYINSEEKISIVNLKEPTLMTETYPMSTVTS